jgi:hypothetical protein
MIQWRVLVKTTGNFWIPAKEKNSFTVWLWLQYSLYYTVFLGDGELKYFEKPFAPRSQYSSDSRCYTIIRISTINLHVTISIHIIATY